MRTRVPLLDPIVFVAAATVIFLAGCGASQPSQQQTLGTEAQAGLSSNVPNSVDCESIADAAPERAGEVLEEAGYTVSWRSVQTASDGTTIADVETSAPPGRIVDIILDGDQAIIFVADSEDPAAASPSPPIC